MPTDLLVALSNIGVIIVTGALILLSIRDARHHEEHARSVDDAENERLVALIDKTLEREHSHGSEQSASEPEVHSTNTDTARRPTGFSAE